MFLEAGRRVPYALENQFSQGGDLDLARIADDRAKSATCVRRRGCREFEVLGLILALLPWLVLPAILGGVLGRQARRSG
jgi:hypothetical protein